MTHDSLHFTTLKKNIKNNDLGSSRLPLLSVFGIFLVIMTAFSGCIFDEDDERDTESFTYYSAAPPTTLDPAVAYDDISINVINNLYETLLTYRTGTNDELEPVIAKSYRLEDSQTYVFYMSKNMRFSSGNTIDAEAVQYSISRVLKMAQAPSWMLRQVLNESGIIIGDFDFDGVPDVKFILEQPYSAFPHIMAFSVSSILDPELVDANGGVAAGQTNSWVAHNSAGSGPYKVANWDEGSTKLTIKKNSKYHPGWKGNHVDEITFKFEGSETLRLKAITGDKADMADIPISLLSNVSEETSVKVDIKDTMSVVFFGFNTEVAPFDNANVRKGFAYAFDYNHMLNIILEKKYGDRLHGPIPEGVLGYDSSIETTFYLDAGKALEFFEAAGYTIQDGNVTDFDPITLSVPSNASVLGRIMHLLKMNLEDIGVTLNIEHMDTYNYSRGLADGDFPIFLAGWSADFADPDDFVYPLLHSDSKNQSISNLARYENASIDSLIEKGKRTQSPDDRDLIYKDIQNGVNEDAPYIWLYQPKSINVLKSDVSGLNKHPILGTDFYNIQIVD